MRMTFRVLAFSTFLIAGAQLALAVDDDIPPTCPGGGTLTGTISCTGTIFKRTCTEGPPWTCTLKDDKAAEAGTGTKKPPRFNFPLESLSATGGDSGGVYDPGAGGGGGGGTGGTVGSPATTATTGGGAPSFL